MNFFPYKLLKIIYFCNWAVFISMFNFMYLSKSYLNAACYYKSTFKWGHVGDCLAAVTE